jgi:hypothetical protein
MNGTVIYVTVNLEGGILSVGDATVFAPAAGEITVVFWDADGDSDEAIELLNTPQVLVEADDIV